MCTRLVPQSLIVEHKTDRKAISSELFACFESEGEAILSRTVISDETWIHHCEQQTRQSVEWHHPQSHGNKKEESTCQKARS